jgi:hypothetical protein
MAKMARIISFWFALKANIQQERQLNINIGMGEFHNFNRVYLVQLRYIWFFNIDRHLNDPETDQATMQIIVFVDIYDSETVA